MDRFEAILNSLHNF